MNHLPRCILLKLSALLLLTACATETAAPPAPDPAPVHAPAVAPATAAAVTRPNNPQYIAQGAAVYAQYCASCHGAKAEGTPAGPSLDGSGHTWHHPLHVLRDKIENGFRVMPAYRDRLSAQEIDNSIVWFQSLWSDEVYRTWYNRWYGDDPSFRNQTRPL